MANFNTIVMKKLLTVIIIFLFSIPLLAQNTAESNGNNHNKRLFEKLKKKGLSDQEIQVEIKNYKEYTQNLENSQLKKNEIEFYEKQTISRTTTSCADIPLAERQALENIYNTLGGATWQHHWPIGTPVTTWNPDNGTGWYGITVGTNCRVVSIDLELNGLSGTTFPNFNAFSSLEFLDLRANDISGSIGSNLNNLSQLKALFLDINHLSGDYSNIGLLGNLEKLFLGNNDFNNPANPNHNNHSIPTSFSNLSKLKWLHLSDCGLNQNLSLIGNYMPNLELLHLSMNNFSGALPSSFYNLLNISSIQMDLNFITDISSLSNSINLNTISFIANEINSIPNGFSNLNNIKRLSLSYNNLSVIPTFIQNYANLNALHLEFNYLQGAVPNLTSLPLKQFSLDNNKLRFKDFINEFSNYNNINSTHVNYEYFRYSPQEKTDTQQSITVNNGDPVTLTMCGDGEFHTDDTFQWYKGSYPNISNPVTIESTSLKSFTFIAHQAATGSYFCLSRHHQPAMTNNSTNSASNLTLVRNQITLTVLGEDPPCYDCTSFDLVKNEKYLVNGWVKEEYTSNPLQQFKNYDKGAISVSFKDVNGAIINTPLVFKASGEIIDGWQRIIGEFVVPVNVDDMELELVNESEAPDAKMVYFDDIRVLPSKGNMKSFVYDQKTQRLMAELDENNYSTFYEYDLEGGLVRIKKETEKGVFTIQETRSGNRKNN